MTGKLARIPSEPPHDPDAEAAVLGAVMLAGGRLLQSLAGEGGLRPEHFHSAAHEETFRAMLAIERDGGQIDPLTVHAQLQRTDRLGVVSHETLNVLAGAVPDLGGASAYAARLVELAGWRGFLDGCLVGLEAVGSQDADRRAEAERLMDTSAAGGEQLGTPERLAERFLDWLDDKSVGTIPTGFTKLDGLLRGGLRPGGTTVLAGWTSMGKSTIGDQILEHAKAHGHSACAYLNEMSEEERIARTLAGRTGVQFDKILGRDMTSREWKRVVGELPNIPFAIQPCSGWTADDIGRHVRRHRWGICLVDLATQLPASTAQDWMAVSRILTQSARMAGTHMLIVVQFNQSRNDGAERPHPAVRDLKGTGAWGDDAANVLLVHRPDEEVAPGIFEPGTDGYVRLAKARNGKVGMVPLTFDPYRMRFESPEDYRVPLKEVIAP